jgi:acetolactate synthase-1/3 small subunit
VRHVISVLVENHFGVLSRISGLFSARGFNIDSLAVGETEDPTISRMTIVVRGDDRILEQVMKQLNKLIDVIKVHDLTKKEFVDRELILFKMNVDSKQSPGVEEFLKKFPVKVLSKEDGLWTIEMTGDEKEIGEVLEFLKPFGIEEMVRTGKIAMAK